MNWIIAYDIADKYRLQKTYRYLSNIAIPLQNSVFLFSGHSNDFKQHFSKLTQELDAEKDDVRAYPLRGRVYSLGKASLPEGIFLSSFPEKHLD